MSDIYVPGIKSRFNTEKLVEDLMRVERVPRDRAERAIEGLRTEKTYWQEIGRRINTLRDSARQLYSFQNPFNERVVISQDESVISGSATREAVEQERSFTVKQLAQADRFLSIPLEDSFRVEEGTYTFAIGKDSVSFPFRGGTLREFTEALNRRGREKIQAGLMAVQSGTKSLLIESLIPGEENRLGFADKAEQLAIQTGMVEQINDSRRDISLSDVSVNMPGDTDMEGPSLISIANGVLKAEAGGSVDIPLNPGLRALPSQVLSFEALTEILTGEVAVAQPPPGPTIPNTGSATYGNITIENDWSVVPIPEWEAPESGKPMDDLGILTLTLSDGSTIHMPPIHDSEKFSSYQYPLADITGNKAIVSITINNPNTRRNIQIQNLRIFDPTITSGGLKPRNPVSLAQDALIAMDGIEIQRSSNVIDDLIPGVTITAKGVSDHPVKIGVEPDRESVKETIISLVGNYNRLMAELNVVTRNDERVIQELTYFSQDEQKELRERLGKFSGDTSLNQFKAGMQRAASSPYPTRADEDLALLAQIGIGTDVRRGGASSGYDASRLRGYLEIDEKALDMALQTRLTTVQRLFGNDTDGDLIIDSGFAYSMERLARPYVETGGLITLKTSSIDSRITQEERRIDVLDRQLAAKEASLKRQYGEMEGAYNRMEQMSNSIDQFSERTNNNNNRR